MVYIITLGHKRFDSRIWVKEIASLTAAGIQVRYIVADGAGNETKSGVEIRDLGPWFLGGYGILSRIRQGLGLMQRGGFRRGDIVHFHDPIFLPFAFLLRLRGCRIIYDVHEDYPRDVLNFPFPMALRRIASWLLSFLEWCAGKLFYAIVTVTPTIVARFPAAKTVLVRNFPVMEELQVPDATPYSSRPLNIVYIGFIARIRGICEMLEAVALVNEHHSIRLTLAGYAEGFSPTTLLQQELASLPGWKYTDVLGFLDRAAVANVLANARIGLVVLHPIKTYPDAYPIKLFEYMSAGIPVIASDFPLWREIVVGNDCGLCVDPMRPEAIAEAIDFLITHPEEAQRMGENGRLAVEEKYSWAGEEPKLLALYSRLLEKAA
uniref:Glycosyltransferase involved in cell wall bisynthesis n=1 Tax=Candidatus Kentrum sp. FM TaxID=2126340 RepID=A0A450VR71_9GAMM|nr:MAG: Glycosyltransferase involved in cell wall bisynthesis [Candidatus Kentron sp. FM]VFJ49582.1 MAG: Glycosyltransferase involved in cell wall bisynthesis [Candidatus Kentron sp. FM]VFK07272.1 MAG: Glycosyltransferase involved in cell wall bisynthesis [Candidatus Kentron sp. FM]